MAQERARKRFVKTRIKFGIKLHQEGSLESRLLGLFSAGLSVGLRVGIVTSQFVGSFVDC